MASECEVYEAWFTVIRRPELFLKVSTDIKMLPEDRRLKCIRYVVCQTASEYPCSVSARADLIIENLCRGVAGSLRTYWCLCERKRIDGWPSIICNFQHCGIILVLTISHHLRETFTHSEQLTAWYLSSLSSSIAIAMRRDGFAFTRCEQKFAILTRICIQWRYANFFFSLATRCLFVKR